MIIGTNKHEAALFRRLKSPLMPITPHTITVAFDQIATEQPDLQLPTQEQFESAYSGMRVQGQGSEHRERAWIPDAIGVAGRGPQQGGAGVPVPIRLVHSDAEAAASRCCPCHGITVCPGNLSSPKDISLMLGGQQTAKAVSARVQSRWRTLATLAKPTGRPGNRNGGPTSRPAAPA